MTEAFSKLSNNDLDALRVALKTNRISAPFSELQLSRVVASSLSRGVADGLNQLSTASFSSDQIASVLEMIVGDRQVGLRSELPIDLVTSGPEAPEITNRDTSVVVRELFTHAQKSVLVVGYAVYQGQQVFEALAKRMEEIPDLDVQFFLNIARPDRDTSPSNILVSKFAERFKSSQWPPECRLPTVYYDPRSVSDDKPVRSSLHAKCIVVDEENVFVSSANFTEAGQARNIEVGLNIQSKWLGQRLVRHFKTLYEHGLAMRAF